MEAPLETVVQVDAADGFDQTRRAADEGLGAGVITDCLAQVLAAEVAVEVARALDARVRVQDADVRPRPGELAQLLVVGDERRRGRVVKEGDVAAVVLIAQRSQHRDHRGDPAAAADQQEPLGAGGGKGEVAAGLRELDEEPGASVLVEPVGDAALGVGANGDLDQARRVCSEPAGE